VLAVSYLPAMERLSQEAFSVLINADEDSSLKSWSRFGGYGEIRQYLGFRVDDTDSDNDISFLHIIEKDNTTKDAEMLRACLFSITHVFRLGNNGGGVDSTISFSHLATTIHESNFPDETRTLSEIIVQKLFLDRRDKLKRTINDIIAVMKPVIGATEDIGVVNRMVEIMNNDIVLNYMYSAVNEASKRSKDTTGISDVTFVLLVIIHGLVSTYFCKLDSNSPRDLVSVFPETRNFVDLITPDDCPYTRWQTCNANMRELFSGQSIPDILNQLNDQNHVNDLLTAKFTISEKVQTQLGIRLYSFPLMQQPNPWISLLTIDDEWDITVFYLLFLNAISMSTVHQQEINWQYWVKNNLPTLHSVRNMTHRQKIMQVLIDADFIASVCLHFAHANAFAFYTSNYLTVLDAICGSKGPKDINSTVTTRSLEKLIRPTASIRNVSDAEFVNIDEGVLSYLPKIVHAIYASQNLYSWIGFTWFDPNVTDPSVIFSELAGYPNAPKSPALNRLPLCTDWLTPADYYDQSATEAWITNGRLLSKLIVSNKINTTAFLCLAANALVEHDYSWTMFVVEFIQQWQADTIDTAAEYKVLVERVMQEAVILTKSNQNSVLNEDGLQELLGQYFSPQFMNTNSDIDIYELSCDLMTIITRTVYDASKEKWLVPIIKDADYQLQGIHALPDRNNVHRPLTERYPEWWMVRTVDNKKTKDSPTETVSYALQHTRLWSNRRSDKITSLVHNVMNNTYKNETLKEFLSWINDNSRVVMIPKLKTVLLWGRQLWELVKSTATKNLMTLINTLNICIQDKSNVLKDKTVFYTGRYIVKMLDFCGGYANDIPDVSVLTETMKNLDTMIRVLPESMAQLVFEDEQLNVADILWQALSTTMSTESEKSTITIQKRKESGKQEVKKNEVDDFVVLGHFVMPGFGYVITVHKSKWIKCIPKQLFASSDMLEEFIQQSTTSSAEKLFLELCKTEIVLATPNQRIQTTFPYVVETSLELYHRQVEISSANVHERDKIPPDEPSRLLLLRYLNRDIPEEDTLTENSEVMKSNMLHTLFERLYVVYNSNLPATVDFLKAFYYISRPVDLKVKMIGIDSNSGNGDLSFLIFNDYGLQTLLLLAVCILIERTKKAHRLHWLTAPTTSTTGTATGNLPSFHAAETIFTNAKRFMSLYHKTKHIQVFIGSQFMENDTTSFVTNFILHNAEQNQDETPLLVMCAYGTETFPVSSLVNAIFKLCIVLRVQLNVIFGLRYVEADMSRLGFKTLFATGGVDETTTKLAEIATTKNLTAELYAWTVMQDFGWISTTQAQSVMEYAEKTCKARVNPPSPNLASLLLQAFTTPESFDETLQRRTGIILDAEILRLERLLDDYGLVWKSAVSSCKRKIRNLTLSNVDTIISLFDENDNDFTKIKLQLDAKGVKV